MNDAALDIVCLEEPTRFSQSVIWQYQQHFFASQGINAWIGAVPFYVTSNAVIAYSYAQIVFRYLQDMLNNKTLNINEPIYIIELGVGTGKFSYLFLHHFTQLIKQFNLTKLPICYVMTDFTDQNLHYWQQHEQLAPFLAQGILDFGIFEIGKDETINLVNKKITLKKDACINSVIVLANYVFDTVPHDVFHVSQGKLEEGLLTIHTPQNNLSDHQPQQLEKLHTNFEFSKLKNNAYYTDANLNKILAEYTHQLEESTFLIPIGAIHCINAIRAFSRNKMLLVTGDKGYTTINSLNGLVTPHIAFHGSFSMMVNFDVITKYIKALGGDANLAFDSDGFKISLFSLGANFDHLPETRLAYEQFVTHLSTKEFLLIKNKLIEHISSLNLSELLAVLKLSYWDPDILMSIAAPLAQKLREGSKVIANECLANLPKIYNNYYFIPNNKNVLFEIGYLYHILSDFKHALQCYEQALAKFGENATLLFNIGLCLYSLGQTRPAALYFKRTLDIEPDFKSAAEWLTKIEKK